MKRIILYSPMIITLLLFGNGYCDTAEEHINQGITYQRTGNIEGALNEYSKALELNPKLYQGYNFRGIIYAMKGKEYLDLAITDFDKALQINPNYAEAYFSRGLAYKYKENLDEAISNFNKAIEIKPDFIDAYNQRAGAYFKKGLYDRSWDDIHKMESLGSKVNPSFLEKLKQASQKIK